MLSINKDSTNPSSSTTYLDKLKSNPALNPGYFSPEKQADLATSITYVPYPKFSEGKPFFTVLKDVQNSKQELTGVMIDGVGLDMGCKGSVYK